MELTTKRSRFIAAFIAVLLGCTIFLLLPCDEASASIENGWNKTKTSYYIKGQAVAGSKKINGVWRAFNSKGVLMKKAFKLGDITFYPNDKGVLRAQEYAGELYYANGKKMILGDAMDFRCLLKAESILKTITNPKDSMETKRYKAFHWVMNKYYATHRKFTYSQVGWPSIHAMDHFNNKNGNCVSDASAFAYLAAAIGYTNVNVCTDTLHDGQGLTHMWCMIGNRIFDPLFAQAKSYNTYYNSTGGSYEVNPRQRFPIPQYSATHASANAQKIPDSAKTTKAKEGLVVKDTYTCYYSKGKLVKKKWVTVGTKKYYFKSNGRAATKSYSIDGKYYVFNKKGVLLKGTKSRVVTIDGIKYNVNAKGRAVSGFSSNSKYYYMKNGERALYPRSINNKLYWFDNTGIYDKDKTNAMRSACVIDAEAKPLLEVLGMPKKVVDLGRGCYEINGTGGDDRMYVYDKLKVYTFLCDDGIEYLIGYE